MVLKREYRIAMPLTVEEYHVGQLYMIARHSHEQSFDGAGVEVIENSDCEDPEHGKGQYTEKRLHLSSRLPYWLQAVCPRVFYIVEKSWNYYPYTFTEYTCSFLPRLNVQIYTKYEDNSGTTENCFNLSDEELAERTVDHIDIAFDDLSNIKHYKREEDPKFFKSKLTDRGPLVEGWRDTDKPIMCSYKSIHASFEVWGLQTRVEDFIQRAIRDVLLLGHRQAFTWIDEWYTMTIDDVRQYEHDMQMETNAKLKATLPSSSIPTTPTTPTTPNTSKSPQSFEDE